MIIGRIKSGSRCASKIPEAIFQLRCEVAKTDLQRGTLNIHVEDLESTISSLGPKHFETDQDNKNGPLRWWRVKLSCGKLQQPEVSAFVVRHERTRTDYLEVMSKINFRNCGLVDEDEVTIKVEIA